METLNNLTGFKAVKKELLKEYKLAKEDGTFKEVVSKLKKSDEYLSNFTTRIQDCCHEIDNCKKCKGIKNCKNSVVGFCYQPEIIDDRLVFSYNACRYQEKLNYLDNVYMFNMPSYVKEASFKDIYVDDKNRIEVIKYLKSYYDNFFKKPLKGLYLSGNFGSGKTYLIAALFNELAKKGVKSAIIYFPEFLRSLKEGFENNTYQEKFNYIKKIPLLLLDDIGAEGVTTWSRDEILGSILQYRMEEGLPTFFTSNLTVKELDEQLSVTNNKVEKVKARRIIERVKYLTEEMELISIDRRK